MVKQKKKKSNIYPDFFLQIYIPETDINLKTPTTTEYHEYERVTTFPKVKA